MARGYGNDPIPLKQSLGAAKRLAGSGLVWFGLALLLVVALVVASVRVGHVDGTEIGILLSKTDGSMLVVQQSGTRLYNGITQDFFTIDKTLHTLWMTSDPSQGDRKQPDALKVKTSDGSDVYVDLKVQYRIVPEMADVVLRRVGPDFEKIPQLVRPFLRALVRDALGTLTTEEFYDSAKRDKKLMAAEQETKRRLEPFGIHIDRIVMPTKPAFYEAYEAMIKQKKLADQAVLEEQSKAHAAKQRQQTMIVEETNKKNVAVEEFRGKMQEIVIAAKAEGERVRKDADAYFDKTTIGAEAEFYALRKEGDSILAEKKAEAEGIEALKKALEGEGGCNMVMLEYARRLKEVTVSGQPFIIRGETERFEHLTPGELSGRRGASASGSDN